MSRGPILVIDDDDEFRESCVDVLVLEGYVVIAMASAREALAYLAAAAPQPSLILLDLMMSEMDGWSFRQQQLTDPLLSDIPVLVLSASGKAGLDAQSPFLSKLVEPTELVAAIARMGDTRA